MGNIYAELRDGFKVSSLKFDQVEYTLEVLSFDIFINYLLKYCREWGKTEVFQVDEKDKALKEFKTFKFSNPFKKLEMTISN